MIKKLKIICAVMMSVMMLVTMFGCEISTGKDKDGQVDVTSYEYLVANSQLLYPATNSNFRYSVYTHYVEITEILTTSANVAIPDVIENLPVVAIHANAFRDCETVKSVRLGKNIMCIQENAFSNCKNLETVVFSSKLRQLGKSAFAKCVKLKSVVLPRTLSSIPSYAFKDCAALTSLSIEESNAQNRTIDNYAFQGCSSLKFAWIPKDVVGIQASAFEKAMDNLTIYGYPSSAAATFSANNLIEFIVLNDSTFKQMVATNSSKLPQYPSVGEKITSSQWHIELISADYQEVIGDFEANSGNQFVILEFEATNVSGRQAFFNGMYATCNDDNNERNMNFVSKGAVPLDFLSGSVAPNEALRGYIIFEINKNFKCVSVDFSQIAGFESLPATFGIYRHSRIPQ